MIFGCQSFFYPRGLALGPGDDRSSVVAHLRPLSTAVATRWQQHSHSCPLPCAATCDGHDAVKTMLTRSPTVPSRSVNSSPKFHGFHYAPNLSPHQSPRASMGSLRRRSQPSPAMSSDTPSQARPRQQQISPSMRPMASADNGSSSQSAGATAAPAPTDPPPTPPGPTPMDTTGGPTNETAAVPATVANAAAEGSAHQQQPASQRADTIKRRNSPSTAPMAQSPATGSKRARPAAPAPKVLPQRYELCSVEDIVILIAHMLGELIETNDPLALQSGNLTRFHSRYETILLNEFTAMHKLTDPAGLHRASQYWTI